MISVVLIDDEFYFRQSLKKVIPWRDLGFHIIGEASNGQEGLELITSLKPDVVILDINMPIMDGFELCEELCNHKIYPKIIFLTGYEEFSYAKLAIQYGAKNYLLKPINPQEVEETLRKLAEDLIAQNRSQEKDKLQNPQYLIALRQKYLLELLSGKLQKETSINNIADLLKIDRHAEYFCTITIRLEHPITPGNSMSSVALASITAANDAFNSYSHSFALSENLIVGIIAMDNVDTEKIQGLSNQLINHLNSSLFSNVTIAIGSIQKQLANIPVSHQDAIDTLCNRLLNGDNQVYDYKMVYSESACTTVITPQIREQLQQALLYFDVRMFSDLIKRIFDVFIDCSCTFRCVRNSCMSIITIVLSSYRTQIPAEFSKMLKTGIAVEQAVHFSSLDELKNLMTTELSNYIRVARKQSPPVILDRAEKIKLYIMENLSDPTLSIDSISKQFYISYHHLCSMFKKQVGVTINNYIMDRRMERAKELIEHKVTNISYIASMVGFNDANYFSRCFKKHFGCSPSRYDQTNS